MVKRGGRANYTAVNLPKELLEDVDYYRKKHPEYRSRAEVVKKAIMDFLEQEKKESVLLKKVKGSAYPPDLKKVLEEIKNRLENLEKKKK